MPALCEARVAVETLHRGLHSDILQIPRGRRCRRGGDVGFKRAGAGAGIVLVLGCGRLGG